MEHRILSVLFGGVLSPVCPTCSVLSPFAALVVGLLQGLLEWLPISSQGNLLMMMMTLLGLEPSQALRTSVYIHVGTGLAALFYFREDILGIARRDSEHDRLLFRFLFLGTAITGIVGFPLFLLARGASRFGEILLSLTGVALIMTGMIQKGAGSGGTKTARSLGTHEGIILGVAQGFSAIPGLSRSGLTSSVLLVRRYSGVEALRISFLMSVPAVFAAAIGLSLIEGLPPLDSGLTVVVAASFLSALLSIDLLLKLARRIRFWGLCVALGLLALLPQVFSLLYIRP